MENSFWRNCSSCKTPIGFKQPYQKCSVSTCNQARTGLVFCSVSCWSAHVPVYRHRDAWAEEQISPSREEWTQTQSSPTTSTTPRPPVLVRNQAPAGSPTLKEAATDEVLVVVSKLKQYIKDRSDMNTSADVMEVLSDKLRRLCDQAIAQARGDGRKTVMGRDF